MQPEKITSQITSDLTTRIATNQQYGSTDLDQWLLERLPLQARQHVLDIGCGVGHHLVKLAKKLADGEYHGIDVSPSSIAKARARAVQEGLRITFVCGDASKVSGFRDAYFDLIMSMYALYYVSDATRVLEECRNKLKEGGHLAVMSPYKGNNKEWYDFLSEIMQIPDSVEWVADSFMDEKVIPVLRTFKSVSLVAFENKINIPGFDALFQYWKSNIYHDAERDAVFGELARRYFDRHDTFTLTKRALLALARS
jgi:ubiquinone/menaquinone biosynthesis C-methylase UbiE